MSDYRIIHADVLDGLRSLPDNSVHVCVTSPPYYGLRSYGVDGQIGLEQTPAEYIARLVEVFAEVRRVVRPDGTAWVNMGDSYAAGKTGRDDSGDNGKFGGPRIEPTQRKAPEGLKPKDLMMMPARLAIALQDAGWWLRSDIIWCKRAPMPESVTDRPASAHEHIFLLSKAGRYFYDGDAIREAHAEPWRGNGEHESNTPHNGRLDDPTGKQQATYTFATRLYNPAGRNAWNYWVLPPESFAAAHFATFPTEIPRRAILAGTSERGCCAECGAPWRRVVEREFVKLANRASTRKAVQPGADMADINSHNVMGYNQTQTTGWQPTCRCNCPTTVPATVLDPFSGAGTTLLVASRLGRRSVGVELNGEYVQMAHKRIQADWQAMNMRMDLTEQAV